MDIFYSDGLTILYYSDCLDCLRAMEANSIDAIITDPPYGLEFMGAEWDKLTRNLMNPTSESDKKRKIEYGRNLSGRMSNLPDYSCRDNTAMQDWHYRWAVEVLRIAKPGAHLLAFGGTRTFHRLACAIEDAGWEIRDCVMWVYGNGFPKSLDVSKAIDKKPLASRIKEWKRWLREQIAKSGKTTTQINDECGFVACSYKDYWSSSFPKNGKWEMMKKVIGITTEEYDWVSEDNTEEHGFVEPTGGLAGGSGNTVGRFTGKQLSRNPVSFEAKQWDGWGTALKPAWEPILVCRKPLEEKTIAENVLAWGTGAINIDGCRVPIGNTDRKIYDKNMACHERYADSREKLGGYGGGWKVNPETIHNKGARWPANLIHDGSDEVMELFPEGGASGKASGPTKGKLGTQGRFGPASGNMGEPCFYDDFGSTARFFYCAKASKSERGAGCEELPGKNNHPTVKPLALMRYLITLITPPGGIVLDPFMGSGTTLVAAKELGFNSIGIEKESEYCEIAKCRIAKTQTQTRLDR